MAPGITRRLNAFAGYGAITAAFVAGLMGGAAATLPYAERPALAHVCKAPAETGSAGIALQLLLDAAGRRGDGDV